jgi:Mn-containing catalase
MNPQITQIFADSTAKAQQRTLYPLSEHTSKSFLYLFARQRMHIHLCGSFGILAADICE